ncbi:MAG: VTT domain-containing protein [Candidatus Saccharimonadales bacterium]
MFETFALFGINPEAIANAGIWLIALIVFAESGLLIGFFLPGDTLLVAAGVLASQGSLSIETTIIAIVVAAVVGDNVGYTIGQLSGKRLFHKKDGILFRHEYVERAQAFYEKHGGKTIILARFVPIVRTFAPMVAGIGKMPRAKFFAYNIIGALIWGIGVTLLGYWLGSKIPNIGEYLEYALLTVIILSLAPAIWHICRDKKSRDLIAQKFRRLIRRHKKHEAGAE